MTNQGWSVRGAALLLLLAAQGAGGCLAQGDEAEAPARDAGVADAGASTPTCRPARSSEKIPARSAILEGRGGTRTRDYAVDDLWAQMETHCGSCHIETNLGGYQCKRGEFDACITDEVFTRIRSCDRVQVMPPVGVTQKTACDRQTSDPVNELDRLLTTWLAAGAPNFGFFPVEVEGGQGSYGIDERVSAQLTNIGDCIPDPELVGTDRARMAELDAQFAAMRSFDDLPPVLSETDLVTFDHAELARTAVLAYQTAYPLWSDDAGKLRHIRLPVGTKISFDPETQQMVFPENARSYKTFLKKVVDDKGRESYRKIETRIIVARSDGPRGSGTYEPRALYGTYAWNEDETEATLVTDPLRDGTPFRDRTVTYLTDEVRAPEIIARGGDVANNLRAAGASRVYAIPGSLRCEQCHMGSPNQNFLLGLSPLQFNLRPNREGGALEDRDVDEVSQVRRFVDYGLLDAWEDEQPGIRLETSQLPRQPRTPEELVAQGYVLGNCAHCHTPRGFPSETIPEIKDILDFYPHRAGGAVTGGIFQFPLAATSPRTFRGPNGNIPIAYITPDLSIDVSRFSTPKVFSAGGVRNPVSAPWRSLIWRNASTPFTYVDDLAVYPKMPQHTPGHDCRAAKVLGDWMTSLVVRPIANLDPEARRTQGFEEARPTDPDYFFLQVQQSLRVSAWKSSPAYLWCPNGNDIVDPGVLTGRGGSVPANTPFRRIPGSELGEGREDISLEDGVPERPHWVVTDLTEIPGDWSPRRTDWDSVLVSRSTPGDTEDEREAVALLQSVRFTPEIRDFSLREVPYAVWQAKPGCRFDAEPLASRAPLASSFVGDARPKWMDIGVVQPSSPIYSVSPGAATFNLVCSQCHGRPADSKSNLARTIADLTGGRTRVANLRDGLFGRTAAGTTSIEQVFGPFASDRGSPDDWAVRYTAWMALGGTQREIPRAILTIVGNTPVAGKLRKNVAALGSVSANMLSVVEGLCRMLLPIYIDDVSGAVTLPQRQFYPTRTDPYRTDDLPLIVENGDRELWEQICTFDNPPPVRVIEPLGGDWRDEMTDIRSLPVFVAGFYRQRTASGSSTYPASAPVADDRGRVRTTLEPTNRAPWCVARPTRADFRARADQFVVANGRPGTPLPFCPDELVTPQNRMTPEELRQWSLRGAVTAGVSVFTYVRDRLQPGLIAPRYDECEAVRE